MAGNANKGFTLVELTIAIAIFSLGLGSLSLLLLMSIQHTAAAGLHAAATGQARSLLESMRLTTGASSAYESPAGPDPSPCAAGSVCPPARMAAWSLHTWRRELAAEIPGATGLVCRDATPDDGSRDDPACDGGPGRVVKVFWEDTGTGEGPAVVERRVVALAPLP